MSQFSFLCQFSSNPIESLQPSTVDSDCKIAEVASIKRFQNRLDSRLVLTALLPVSDRVAYPHIIQRFMSGVISQKAHIEAWLIEYLKIGIAFKRGNIR